MVDIASWRAQIGLFNVGPRRLVCAVSAESNVVNAKSDCASITQIALLVVRAALLSGDIETNPGPRSKQKKKQQQLKCKTEEALKCSKSGLASAAGSASQTIPKTLPEKSSQLSPGNTQSMIQNSADQHGTSSVTPTKSETKPKSSQKSSNKPQNSSKAETKHSSQGTNSRSDTCNSNQGATSQERSIYKVSHLNNFAVPIKKLKCPEYCFDIVMDFTLKRKDLGFAEQIEAVGKTACAMMNHSGGVITLVPQTGFTDKELDDWVNNIIQHFKMVLPNNILCKCIDIKVKELEIWVKRSKQVITYRTYLYTKLGNTTIEVGNDMIIETMKKRKPVVISNLDGIDLTNLVYEDTFIPQEDKHLELKHYTATTDGDSLIERIIADQVKGECKVVRSLLAFANTEGGGDLIIGIREEVDGNRILRGLPLSSDDEQTVQEELWKYITEGLNGQRRIWPFHPTNRVWDIKFYPLAQCPAGKRYVLIHIRVNQIDDCVFAQAPECYTLSSRGNIRSISHNEWKKAILMTPQFLEQQQNGTANGSSKESKDKSQIIDPELLSSLAGDMKKHMVALSSRDTKAAFWSKDSDNWTADENPGSGYNIMKYIQDLSKSEYLSPCQPLMWVPSRSIMDKWILGQQTNRNSPFYMEKNGSRVNHLDDVEQFYTQANVTAVVIGTTSLKAIFPSLDLNRPKQAHGGFELIVLHNSSELDVWTFCKNKTTGELMKSYTLDAIRMLRMQLFSELYKFTGSEATDIKIRGLIWNLEKRELFDTVQSEIRSDVSLDDMQVAVSSLMLQGRSHMRNRLGEDSLTALTKDQLSCLIGYNLAQMNIIRGPPGSGKTIMAMHICDREADIHNVPKKKILYLCPHEPLAEHIKFQKKCEVKVIKTGDELEKEIKSAIANNILCIILDDAQFLNCKKHQWMDILKLIDSPPHLLKFVILLDSAYQNYMFNADRELTKAIRLFQEKNQFCTIEQYRTLHEMLRNSKTIFSFFKCNAETEGRDRLICLHDFVGDDVSVHYCDDFFVMSRDNPVLLLTSQIIGLYNFEEEFVYEARDVTILVDADQQGEAEKYVQQYTQIFRQFYQEVKVQSASKVPANGVVIEELRKFSGLESRVCIIVLISRDTSLLENSRYRLFAASRGITKVAFLLDGETVNSSLGMLKFSEDKQWRKLTNEIWHAAPQTIITERNPERWVQLNIPKTDIWRQRTDGPMQLRKLLDAGGDVAELQSVLTDTIPEPEHAGILNECMKKLADTHGFDLSSDWTQPFISESAVLPKAMDRFILLYHLIKDVPATGVKGYIETNILEGQRDQILAASIQYLAYRHRYNKSGDWSIAFQPINKGNNLARFMLLLSLLQKAPVDYIHDHILRNFCGQEQQDMIHACVRYLMTTGRLEETDDWLYAFLPHGSPTDLAQLCVLHQLVGKATSMQIMDWIKKTVPKDQQPELEQSWMNYVIYERIKQKMHHIIFSMDIIDDDILPHWRTDEQFIQATMKLALKVTTEKEDDYRSREKTLENFLCGLDILYDASENTQMLAINTVHAHVQAAGYPQGVLYEYFHLLWHDNYISRDTLQKWFSNVDQPTRTSCGEDVLKLLTYSEKNPQLDAQSRKRFSRSLDGDRLSTMADTMGMFGGTKGSPHYQRVQLKSLCELAIDKDGVMNRQLLGRFIHMFDSQNKMQLLYTIQTVVHQLNHPPGLAVALIEVSLLWCGESKKFEPTTLLQWWDSTQPAYQKGRDVLVKLLDDRMKLLQLVESGTSEDEIKSWISEKPEQKKVELSQFWMVILINKGKQPRDVRDGNIEDITLHWMQYIIGMILYKIPHEDNDLSEWVDRHILPVWRQLPLMIDAIMTAVMKASVELDFDGYGFTVGVLRRSLGAVNCLYGAPNKSQDMALLALIAHALESEHPGDVIHQVLHTLWYDCYISTDIMLQRLEQFGRDIKPDFGEPLRKLLTGPEKNQHLLGNLRKKFQNHVDGKKKIKDWIGSTLTLNKKGDPSRKLTDWYDLPHYQRVVLHALCQAALKGNSHGRSVDKSQLKKFIQPLFCDVKDKNRLLYAVQTVVHKLGHPPGLSVGLVLAIISMKDGTGAAVFTREDFLSWRNEPYACYEEGRERIVIDTQVIAESLHK